MSLHYLVFPLQPRDRAIADKVTGDRRRDHRFLVDLVKYDGNWDRNGTLKAVRQTEDFTSLWDDVLELNEDYREEDEVEYMDIVLDKAKAPSETQREFLRELITEAEALEFGGRDLVAGLHHQVATGVVAEAVLFALLDPTTGISLGSALYFQYPHDRVATCIGALASLPAFFARFALNPYEVFYDSAQDVAESSGVDELRVQNPSARETAFFLRANWTCDQEEQPELCLKHIGPPIYE